MKNLITILFFLFALDGYGQKQDLNRLTLSIDSITRANGIEGLQVAIVSKDGILYQANFGKVKGGDGPINDASVFCVSSITKSFTSLGIMKLVERGALDLDDKLNDLAPEITFENPWEATHPLRVVHLLEHTTGWSDVLFAQYAADRSELSVFEQANDFPNSRVCRYPPGQYFSYQNTGPTVAGYLIEKVSGMPYADFIQREILEPLQMQRSFLDPPSQTEKDHSAVAMDGHSPYRLIVDQPAGGLYTNGTDMAKYLQLFLNQGTRDGVELLSPESIERMTTAESTLSGKSGYENGYGLGLWSDRFKGVRVIGHSGEQPGFGAFILFIPELDRAFFVAANTELPPVYPVISSLLNFIVDPDGSWKPSAGKPVTRESIIGYYRSISTPSNTEKPIAFLNPIVNISRIEEKGGELVYSTLTNPTLHRLYEDRAHHLYYTDEEGYKNWFFVGEDWQGNDILQNGKSSGNLKKVSAFSVWSCIVFAAICLLAFLTLPVVLLIRLFMRYSSRHALSFQRPIQLAGAAAASLFMSILILALKTPPLTSPPNEIWQLMDTLGKPTPTSLAVFTLTLLFGCLSIAALFTGIRYIRTYKSPLLKLYIFGLSFAFTLLSVYLFQFDMVPFRSWVF